MFTTTIPYPVICIYSNWLIIVVVVSNTPINRCTADNGRMYNVGAGCPALVCYKMTINIFVGRLNVSWIIRCCRWVDGKEMIVINDCPPPPSPRWPRRRPSVYVDVCIRDGALCCAHAQKGFGEKKRVDRTRPRAKGQGSRLVCLCIIGTGPLTINRLVVYMYTI